jgi:hypothetical protein
LIDDAIGGSVNGAFERFHGYHMGHLLVNFSPLAQASYSRLEGRSVIVVKWLFDYIKEEVTSFGLILIGLFMLAAVSLLFDLWRAFITKLWGVNESRAQNEE